MAKKTKGWSAERRQKQAENIRKTKPWEKATGPRTEKGKETASQNALKHGLDSAEIRELRRLLHLQRACLKGQDAACHTTPSAIPFTHEQ